LRFQPTIAACQAFQKTTVLRLSTIGVVYMKTSLYWQGCWDLEADSGRPLLPKKQSRKRCDFWSKLL